MLEGLDKTDQIINPIGMTKKSDLKTLKFYPEFPEIVDDLWR